MEKLIQLREIAKVYIIGKTIEVPALSSINLDIEKNE